MCEHVYMLGSGVGIFGFKCILDQVYLLCTCILICIIFVRVYFCIMLLFTIHSRFTLCDLLFILLA